MKFLLIALRTGPGARRRDGELWSAEGLLSRPPQRGVPDNIGNGGITGTGGAEIGESTIITGNGGQ